jgi:hypothetical protein
MGCGEGVANVPDTGVDGDSTAVNRLSILSIMVSTIGISELVICEVGPETSVAGEGDRPAVVDGCGVSERPCLAE